VTLAPGTRLGAYEILSLIGSGGMGEVYRARDSRLNRDVAIKALPSEVAADHDRLARFEREAQVLASLNHTNIANIYGVDDSSGTPALIMELVEGPTLADRIAKGPIPLDEALPIAKQIAEALEAAHEQGIIHRDLKPANIKVRPDGTVKVLDFGLAKALEAIPSSAGNATMSPTITTPAMTQVGLILGTAAYMSPEQARGKPVDKRADIWAFGCVLFEMLTSRKAFEGETLSDTVAAIVKNDPDWRGLPRGTPSAVQLVIARCLRKDPAQRLHDIADGRLQIEEALNQPVGTAAAVSPARSRREWAAWLAAGLFLGAALFLAARLYAVRPSINSSSADAISFPVFPPDNTAFSGAGNTTVNVPSFSLAPDGHALVFSAGAPGARPTLWLRSLDHMSARQLPGTEDAQNPTWSPDSRWISFVADGKLKKVQAAGGPVQVILQTSTDFRGSTWAADDTILFGGGREILSVNASGGPTAAVTIIDAAHQEGAHRTPQALPDGHHFLYSIFGRRPDHVGVYAGSLDGRTKKALIPVTTSAIYAPPGYVLFVDGDTLLGQGFDAERLELHGEPFLVAEHVGRDTTFASAVSASRTGTLAYAGTLAQIGRLTWMDRRGHPFSSTGTPEGDYADFRLSPDDTRLAAALFDPKTNVVEMWLMDLARGSHSRVSAGGGVTASGLWSPDGTRLTFRTGRNGFIEFYQRSAAGGGDDRTVLSLEAYEASQIPSPNLVPTDWSPDGRQIIFSVSAPASSSDLWLLPLGENGRPTKFIASPAQKMHANFSPDGRLVAYTSNESGRFEVYVETVPRSDRKWPVSTNGGYEPRWRADGRELYYLSEDRKLMAVAVGAGPSFAIPKLLFQTHVPAGVSPNRTHYVPSRDGQRFLVNIAVEAPVSPITVVINWTSGLKK
jgi:serine/threonine protein kinase/Tol biopolymer transport system component